MSVASRGQEILPDSVIGDDSRQAMLHMQYIFLALLDWATSQGRRGSYACR